MPRRAERGGAASGSVASGSGSGSAAGTPALAVLARAGVGHEVTAYEVGAGEEPYGRRAARALGVPSDVMLKTLVVRLAGPDGGLACGVLAVDAALDTKALAAALGRKKASLADPADAERSTGYVAGGISPFGQRTPLPTVVDDAALAHPRVWVSAGRRGLAVALDPRDLVRLTEAVVGPVRQSV